MKEEGKKSLLKLFTGIFMVSAFTFGGGFVIVTFLKRKFVDELHWIDEPEMLDYIALAQSCPGSITVNVSILLGWNTFGFIGMLVAVLAAILPPMIILTIVSIFYRFFAENRAVALVLKGMQAGVAAVITDAALNMGRNVVKEKNVLHMLIMAAAFAASMVFGVNEMLIIGIALAVGIVEFLLTRGRKGAGA